MLLPGNWKHIRRQAVGRVILQCRGLLKLALSKIDNKKINIKNVFKKADENNLFDFIMINISLVFF